MIKGSNATIYIEFRLILEFRFIERFFSVCGVINTDRNQNMKHDLFEIYAYLTSNMHILHTLKIQ
jgi:hypothetical protein